MAVSMHTLVLRQRETGSRHDTDDEKSPGGTTMLNERDAWNYKNATNLGVARALTDSKKKHSRQNNKLKLL